MVFFSASLFLLLLPSIVQSYNLFDFGRDDARVESETKHEEGSRYQEVDDDDIKQRDVRSHRNLNGLGPNLDHQPISNVAHYLAKPMPERREGNEGMFSDTLRPNDSTLSTGLFHTCAITNRAGIDTEMCGGYACGPAKCWGHNEQGQSSPPPGVVFQQISAGGMFTCGIRAGGGGGSSARGEMIGMIACWGDIDHPPKSLESLSSEEQSNVKYARETNPHNYGIDNPMTTKPIDGGGYARQISSGNKHACAISRNYEVHCWGRNDYGESSPPEGKFAQISAGHSFTCGIRPNGSVDCWGKNDMGQSSPPNYLFEHVGASIGGEHACGLLKEDGDVRCWGNNGRGQARDQDGKFLVVTAGIRTTCAVRVDETADMSIDTYGRGKTQQQTSLHCWGSRADVLLNHIELDQEMNSNNTDVEHSQISLGQDHACAFAKKKNPGDGSNIPLYQTSLQCWWLAGSDFDAHRIPVGLEMVS